MMNKIIRAGIAVAALSLMPLAAQAADLNRGSYKAPAYTAPSYVNWTGLYLGINGGYGFGKANISNAFGTSGDFNVNGAVVGGTVGYNFQTGIWVWGIEGDLDYSTMKGSTTVGCVTECTVSNTWLGTARARIGYAGWGNWLPFITGGAAFGNVKTDFGGLTDDKTKIGWTAGLGLEYALLTNWSVKGEYLYTDLGSATCAAGTCGVDTTTKFKANLVRLGVNYRF